MEIGIANRVRLGSESIDVGRLDFRTEAPAVAKAQIVRDDYQEIRALLGHGDDAQL